MQMDYEVIVIGGGFAGITAARDLRAAGHSVVVFEARDRLGGRTYYREFGDTTQKVEFGGTWIAPRWQPNIGAEIDRYGAALVESPQGQEFAWAIGGEMRRGPVAVPTDEWLDFERAVVELSIAGRRIKFGQPLDQQDLGDLDISYEQYIDNMGLPKKTRDFILAWSCFCFGAEPKDASALAFLVWVAGFDNSAIAICWSVTEKLANGTGGLIKDIADDSGADIIFETPIRTIGASDDGVTITTRAGDRFRGKTLVCAAPLNTWESFEFLPGLSEGKAEIAAQKQTGHATKVWALVRNVPGNFYGAGWDTTLKWIATEYNTPEGDLIVGFGTTPDELDVTDSSAVTASIKQFLPDAEVVATDAHDWNADEFAQGTWMAFRPGQAMRFASVIQETEGRIVFAGSDLASGWVGWMDGAVESGHRAARDALAILSRDPAVGRV